MGALPLSKENAVFIQHSAGWLLVMGLWYVKSKALPEKGCEVLGCHFNFRCSTSKMANLFILTKENRRFTQVSAKKNQDGNNPGEQSRKNNCKDKRNLLLWWLCF